MADDSNWVRVADVDSSITDDPDPELAWGRLFTVLGFIQALTDELESDDDA